MKVFIPTPPRPSPNAPRSLFARITQQYFSGFWQASLTVVSVLLLYLLLKPMVEWAFIDAVWVASSRSECFAINADGACWAGIVEWFNNIMYGRYPDASQWRVNGVFISLFIWFAAALIPRFPYRKAVVVSLWLLMPFYATFFFAGGEHSVVFQLLFSLSAAAFILIALNLAALLMGKTVTMTRSQYQWALLVIGLCIFALQVYFSLDRVETDRWGGLFLTLIIAGVAIMMALPIGIILALGRRSEMPVIKLLSVGFIELVRSVPLITVLFMAVTMLPFFLPSSMELNKLAQVLVAVSLFAGAYMAENVRGGLQAIPIGQIEAAKAMGMSYWHTTLLVVLPQALRMMIPNIVTSFISLLKDTTLVSIIGLFDILLMAKNMAIDKNWLDLHTEPLVFIAVIFFVLCYSMSQYSLHLEKKLNWN